MDIIYFVVPCYNEQEVINETSKRLLEKITALIDKQKISAHSKILFVDDGSKDDTWNMICELNKLNDIFKGVKLSRNKGHQYALLAGLMTAKEHCDAAISLDADLQDDIEVIDEFIQKYLEGNDVVYGVRKARSTDTAFKRSTAQGFYKFMKTLGVDIVYNHADYRLLSKKVLDSLSKYDEVNVFLRGIVPHIGFKSDTVEYERHERFAGESKYPLKKMLSFAWDGVTSFSVKPIRLMLCLGAAIFIISLILLIVFLIRDLCSFGSISVAITALSVWCVGGLQLAAIGMVGEYIGKIYMETKRRPKYIIEKVL